MVLKGANYIHQGTLSFSFWRCGKMALLSLMDNLVLLLSVRRVAASYWLFGLLVWADLPPGAVAVHLTEEEQAAIQRLETLGFDRNRCIEAFLLCERDETLAANFLFDSAMDE